MLQELKKEKRIPLAFVHSLNRLHLLKDSHIKVFSLKGNEKSSEDILQ